MALLFWVRTHQFQEAAWRRSGLLNPWTHSMVIPKSLNVQFDAHTPTLLPWTVGKSKWKLLKRNFLPNPVQNSNKSKAILFLRGMGEKKRKGYISIYFTSLVSTKTRQALKDDCRWHHSTKPKHSCCTRCGIFVEPDEHGLGYMECSHWTGKYKKEDQKQRTACITPAWGLDQLSHLLS